MAKFQLMKAIKEQFQKYYTPKRCLINAAIMFTAVIFFISQKPDELFYSIGFGAIGVAYLFAFFFLKTRQ